MMLGLSVVTFASAANDPDSTGRAVKYLDSMSGTIISYYTPDSQCFQFVPPLLPPIRPITCVALSADGLKTLPATSVGEIVVPANQSRSMLSLNMQPVADYSLNNPSETRGTFLVSTLVTVAIESSVLNDPTLINPRTGQPFNGKIEESFRWFFDRRTAQPGDSFSIGNKMPFELTIVSRQILGSWYGLSSTRAALVFARPITVKVGLTGNLIGSGRANFFMSGRLFGD
jgi:hypothetical protein